MIIADTDPALSIPVPDPIGRLYRQPGSEPVPTAASGAVILPDDKEIQQRIIDGVWMPSITNVLNVRNMPHLVGWAARKAANLAVETEQKYPGRIAAEPRKAFAYFASAADRDRDAAAVQGTLVHEACEFLAKGEQPPKPLTDIQQKYVDNWKRWADEWQPEFIALEATVFGTTPQGLAYAGTTDFIAKINGMVTIGDIKTTRSGLHIDLALQLSAAAHAQRVSFDDRTFSPMLDIEAAIGLHLSPERYRVAPVQLDGQVWDTFCALRSAWNFHVFHGHLDNGKNALGGFLSGPEALKPLEGRKKA